MRLTHHFTVPAGIDEAWAACNDLAAIAPCFPGASLTNVDGDSFGGSVKVKLGPMILVYNGFGSYQRRDKRHYRVVLEAQGRDRRGSGTATAAVTVTLVPQGSLTAAELVTDLTITGRPAQLGRGVIDEASHHLLEQFVNCLSTRFAEHSVVAAPAIGAAATDGSPAEPVQEASSEPIEGSLLDRLRSATPVLAHRYGLYAVGGLWVLMMIMRRRAKRRSKS